MPSVVPPPPPADLPETLEAAWDDLTGEGKVVWQVLALLDPDDRFHTIVSAVWPGLEARHASARGALAPGLTDLTEEELVGVDLQGDDEELILTEGAEGWLRERADKFLAQAVAHELGNLWGAQAMQALQEGVGSLPALQVSALRGIPYLLRASRLDEAFWLLEKLLGAQPGPGMANAAIELADRCLNASLEPKKRCAALVLLGRARLQGGAQGAIEVLEEALTLAEGDEKLFQGAGLWLLRATERAQGPMEALSLATRLGTRHPVLAQEAWRVGFDALSLVDDALAEGQVAQAHAMAENLEKYLTTLPMPEEADQADACWQLREVLLDRGAQAASLIGRWEDACRLQNKLESLSLRRGEPPLELARLRFNRATLLAQGEKTEEALAVLEECLGIFRGAGARREEAQVLGLQADLAFRQGNAPRARQLGTESVKVAVGCGELAGAAVSLFNLAGCLETDGQQDLMAMICAALLGTRAGHPIGPATVASLGDRLTSPPTLTAEALEAYFSALTGSSLGDLLRDATPGATALETALKSLWHAVFEVS